MEKSSDLLDSVHRGGFSPSGVLEILGLKDMDSNMLIGAYPSLSKEDMSAPSPLSGPDRTGPDLYRILCVSIIKLTH